MAELAPDLGESANSRELLKSLKASARELAKSLKAEARERDKWWTPQAPQERRDETPVQTAAREVNEAADALYEALAKIPNGKKAPAKKKPAVAEKPKKRGEAS